MSTSGEDDSRPSRPLISQRPTARDVPIAKYAEPSSAPRGLRGQSLMPGQGAPERVAPEDVGLAVVREADTLDGLHVARVTARRLPELTSSPPPTPVSVEVPRVRSAPPSNEAYATTPTTPSARSIQSGTLMSVGSVDPRAPTELSLPSPRVLSQSERAAYFGPEAVVDRTPVSALPNASPGLMNLAQRLELGEGQGLESQPMPHSSARSSTSVGPSPPESSARRSQKADSPAPIGRHFGRGPSSYSPLSATPAPPSPARVSVPSSLDGQAPQFEIHAQLDAVPHGLFEDNFDLRSASTQREPLASRKPVESSDWTTVHDPVSVPRDSTPPGERGPSRNPSSSSAITILVDSGRLSVAATQRDSTPNALPTPPARASVPVSWVLAAAAFALLLALIVAWVARVPAVPESASPADQHHPIEPSLALRTALPALQAALPAPTATAPAERLDRNGAAGTPLANGAGAAAKPAPAASAPHGLDPAASAGSAARAVPSAATSAHSSDLHAPAASSPEGATKLHQSIY